MFNCYIIGNQGTQNAISEFLSLVDFFNLTGTSSDLNALLSNIKQLTIDVIYIDASFLNSCKDEIIYLSNFSSIVILGELPEQAYPALEAHASDFLLVPVNYGRFLSSIIKIKKIRLRELQNRLKRIEDETDYFFIRKDSKGKKIIRIKHDDIIYIEACQNYITIYLDNCNHLTYLTMKEILESLPAQKFSRIHKSYIINDKKVTAIDGNQVVLINNDKIMLGLTYRSGFFNKLNNNLLKSKRYYPVEK